MPPAPRRGPRAIVIASLLAAALGTAAPPIASAAGGKSAKGKPFRPPPDPPESLPAGCTRLTNGYGAVTSPDGKWIAYVQGGARTVLYRRVPPNPIEVRIRDSKADMSIYTTLPVGARPLGWVEGTLLLASGIGVEPVRGAKSPKVASLPVDVRAAELAWTRDGRQLAFARAVTGTAPTVVEVVGLDGTRRTLVGTEGMRADQRIVLAWSPDATRLYVNALFQQDHEGGTKVPVRRVGLVDATTGAMTELATMPDWIGIPGLHDESPAYRDPRLADPKLVDLGTSPPSEPRYGRQPWSGDGRIATWLAGTGWYEADAFVVDAQTGEIVRVTNDGDVKWSPALDRTGRRLAFLTADGIDFRERIKAPRIRIVDLLTGEPTEIRTAFDGGLPSWLSWSADGGSLIYDVRDVDREGTFSQSVPPAKPVATDAKICAAEYSARNRIVSWLGSYDEDRVHTAVHRAEDGWDPYYLPALRETLSRWKEKDGPVVGCLVKMLDRKRLTETIPDLRAALTTKDEGNRLSILEALFHLGERDALDEIDRLRAATVSSALRLDAGFVLVAAGDERGWPAIVEGSNSAEWFVRREVCRKLAKIRHPKSIEILIPLVADRRQDTGAVDLARFGIKRSDTVAPLAQLALRALTGKSLGDDPVKWRAWWKDEAKGVLPIDVPPPDDPGHQLGG